MRREEVKVGARVASRIDFAGVPAGTRGVIDELYASGFMVAWDLADRPLPAGYSRLCLEPEFEPAWQCQRGAPLRDGFSYVDPDDLEYLEHVETIGA